MDHAAGSKRVEFILSELQWLGNVPSPDQFHALDGRLIIRIDDRLFFDGWILPLELSGVVVRWQALVSYGIAKTLTYTSVDEDEDPLLEFRSVTPETWTIRSPWQEMDAPDDLTVEQLLRAVEDFQNTLKHFLNF